MAAELIKDELKKALQNISGKTLAGSQATTAEMLHAFNELYICKVKFDVIDGDAASIEDAVITVKSGDTVIAQEDDGKYYLPAGSYTYDCTAEGYTAITGTELKIAAADVTRGTKSVTVTMTAAS